MAVPREQTYDITEAFKTGISFDDPYSDSAVESSNEILLGNTQRASASSGRVVTVAPGEDILVAIATIKSVGGGTVLLLPGTHRVSYNIVLPSNTTLKGYGASDTIIDFQGGSYLIKNEPVTTDSTGTIAITQGSKTVTGTSTAFTSTTFVPGKTALFLPTNSGQWYGVASIASDTSLTLADEYNSLSFTGAGNFELGNPSFNITVSNLTLQNVTGDVIQIAKCHGVTITDCVFTASANGIDIYLSDEITITSCKFVDITTAGIYLDSCGQPYISQCIFINNALGVQFYLVTHGLVVHCQFHGHSSEDIRCEDGWNTSIDGVLSMNSGGGIYVADGGARITNSFIRNPLAAGITIADNGITVSTCTISDAGTYGIRIESNSFACTVVACTITNSTTDDFYDPSETTTISGCSNIFWYQESEVYSCYNNTGGTLARGAVVIYDLSPYTNEVNTTTTLGDKKVLGVVMQQSTNATTAYVKTRGYTDYLKVNGTTDIAQGDFLTCYTEAGIACKASAGDMVFAIANEAYTGDDSNGVIDAIIISPRLI